MDAEQKLLKEIEKIDMVTNQKNYQFSRDAEPSGDASGMWSSEIKAFLDASTLKALFYGEDWVYIVTDLIANKISAQSLEIIQVTEDPENEGEMVEQVNQQHPLNDLFEQPNEMQDYHSWMYSYVVDLTLLGNGINWQSPRTGHIHLLAADRITIDFDPDQAIRSYMMADQNEDMPELMKFHKFDPKEIWHTRRPNPASMIWGLSPFVPGRKSILFNRYSTDYLNAFYLKGATPGVALSMDKVINEENSLRLLRSFEMAYGGRRNMRRPLVLPKGVDIKTLTHSLSDQRLVETINTNRETILSLLKVPKHEVGLQTAGSLGSEEYKVSLRNFWDATLKPTMRMITGMMNKFFAKDLGEDNYIRFNLDDVKALYEDKNEKADLALKLTQFMTLNEVRKELYDMVPIDGGDIPLSLQKPAASGFGAVNVPSAFTDVVPSTNVEEEEAEEVEERSIKKIDKTTIMDRYKIDIDYHVKQIDDELNRTGQEMVEFILNQYVEMAGIAIEEWEKLKKHFRPSRTKADDDPPDIKILRDRIERQMQNRLKEEYVDFNVKTLSDSYDLGFESQLTTVFNQPNQDAIRAIAAEQDGKNLLLEARALDSFDSVSSTYTDQVLNQVKQGMQRSESVDKITNRIRDVFLKDPEAKLGMAETVARTETLHAVSQGQWATASAAKEVIPGLRKRWITAGDNRVRDSHAPLDGDVIDMDQNFDNGLKYPREPGSPAGEAINCRCSIILIPPEEE